MLMVEDIKLGCDGFGHRF